MRSLHGIVVVLVGTDGSENAGSVARLCGNFGCALRFVDVHAQLDCRDAWKMAHPCEQLLDEAPRFPSLAAAIADCSLVIATSGKIAEALDRDAVDVATARHWWPSPGERTALVFGNERTGLSVVDAERCHRVVQLPTPGHAHSLNLASAVAVTLTLVAEAGRQPSSVRASASSQQQLLNTLEQRLFYSGFYKGRDPAGFRPRLVELLAKTDFSSRDNELMTDVIIALSSSPSSPPVPPAGPAPSPPTAADDDPLPPDPRAPHPAKPSPSSS
jgi:tRNA (cytidine32/uridine32-2'-O)-methyltransferase